jgi:drug/metabolite transporter (DMT)-like permease
MSTEQKNATSRWAIVALVVMSLIWGYNWVVMKQVVQYVDPFDFSAVRTLFGALSLFAVILVMRRPLKLEALPWVLLLGVLQTAAFTGLIQWALVSADAGKTAVLVYTMPFWLLGLAWWLLGERIRPVQGLTLLIAGSGMVLILEPWGEQGLSRSDLLAVTGGLVWALSAVVAKRLRPKIQMDVLAVTAWQMLFGSLILCAVAWFLPDSRPLNPVPYFYGALFFNAVFATALAWWLWLYVLQNLSAGMAGLSVLSIPLIGVLSGWLELGERPQGFELTGMLLMGAALALTCVWTLISARRRPGG